MLTRDIIFNGIEFPVAIPIESELTWRAYRFSYEYDFIYRDRGFVGLVLETKYTDVEAQPDERPRPGVRPRPGPDPRRRPHRTRICRAQHLDHRRVHVLQAAGNPGQQRPLLRHRLYGTVNFTDNVGAQGGYRSFDVIYKVENDNGDLQMKGLYFGGVLRF